MFVGPIVTKLSKEGNDFSVPISEPCNVNKVFFTY